MEQTKWITTLLLVTTVTVCNVNSDSHVIVRPTDSDPSICGDYVTCDTLSNVFSNNSAIFGEENYQWTLAFLNGKHLVKTQSQAKVENINNVTLFGIEYTVVTCEVSFFFTFVNIESLKIRDLKFLKINVEAKYSTRYRFFMKGFSLHCSLIM